MKLQLDGAASWISPVCLAAAILLFYTGTGFRSSAEGWAAPVIWMACGGLAATGLMFSLVQLMAATQYLRVARARLSQRPSNSASPSSRPRRGTFGPTTN